jgi:hypothetical protein
MDGEIGIAPQQRLLDLAREEALVLMITSSAVSPS